MTDSDDLDQTGISDVAYSNLQKPSTKNSVLRGSSKSDALENVFSDINMDFVPHPVNGDIIPLKNADAVKRAIRNLLYTEHFERPFAPNLGANLKQLLFEPINPMTKMSIELLIRDTIKLYERRASIIELKVTINEDENGYDVFMVIAIDNTSEVISVDFFLERLR